MIEKFKDIEPRSSGVIYKSMLEQIKKLYTTDPQLAGELAISAIEMVLTDEFSSDNAFVDMLLVPAKIVNDGNVNKRNEKIERAREKRMIDNKLEQIAKLLNEGYSQGQIGTLMNVSQQTISRRVSLIKSEYPELLVKSQPKMVVEVSSKEKMVVDTSNFKEKWYTHF